MTGSQCKGSCVVSHVQVVTFIKIGQSLRPWVVVNRLAFLFVFTQRYPISSEKSGRVLLNSGMQCSRAPCKAAPDSPEDDGNHGSGHSEVVGSLCVLVTCIQTGALLSIAVAWLTSGRRRERSPQQATQSLYVAFGSGRGCDSGLRHSGWP